jgi:hypothetical protein
MLLVNGVRTLVDVVIANPIQVDLVSYVVISCGVATSCGLSGRWFLL